MEEYISIEVSGVYFECCHGDYVAETIGCEHPEATQHEVCGVMAEVMRIIYRTLTPIKRPVHTQRRSAYQYGSGGSVYACS